MERQCADRRGIPLPVLALWPGNLHSTAAGILCWEVDDVWVLLLLCGIQAEVERGQVEPILAAFGVGGAVHPGRERGLQHQCTVETSMFEYLWSCDIINAIGGCGHVHSSVITVAGFGFLNCVGAVL